jgi:IclR family pca regulon transcriptional regulator
MQERPDGIQSLERGMRVLEAFGDETLRPTVSEIAAKLDLSRPAVRRILLTFERMGYVRQDHGTWALTPRVLEIGEGFFVGNSLPELAQPLLRELAERTEESAALSVFDGRDVVHIARVEVRRIMRHTIRVGSRLPAHATAMGKVLLGGLEPAALDAYFQGPPREAYTPRTITDEQTLRERIAEDRARGYSISIEELEAGMLAAAVAVRGRDGSVLAALSSTSTTNRSSVEKLEHQVVPMLRELAADIGRVSHPGRNDVLELGPNTH